MDVSGFTSVPLTDNMLEKFSLTIDSLRRDNPDVHNSSRAPAKGTYQFIYKNNKTLVFYKPKNDKIIL